MSVKCQPYFLLLSVDYICLFLSMTRSLTQLNKKERKKPVMHLSWPLCKTGFWRCHSSLPGNSKQMTLSKINLFDKRHKEGIKYNNIFCQHDPFNSTVSYLYDGRLARISLLLFASESSDDKSSSTVATWAREMANINL